VPVVETGKGEECEGFGKVGRRVHGFRLFLGSGDCGVKG
jgi:hypothetical protein